jgi:hypothetical protein
MPPSTLMTVPVTKSDSSPARNTTAPTSAEQCFRQALEIARQQNARSLELRAATSLADCSGKRDEARRHVEEVYSCSRKGSTPPI